MSLTIPSSGIPAKPRRKMLELPDDVAGERVLSFQQIAELEHQSKSTVRRRVEMGELGPVVKTSKRGRGVTFKHVIACRRVG